MKSIISVIGALILGIILAASADIATTAEAPKWVGQVLDLLSYLSVVAAFLFFLTGLWVYRKQIMAWLKDLLKNPEPKAELTPEPAEAKQVQDGMNQLITLLSQIQPGIEEADIRLLDARVKTGVLVDQILGIAEKLEKMEVQKEGLEYALKAIENHNREALAFCSGLIDDIDIKKILLSSHIIKRESFRIEAITMISNQMGAIRQWSQGYERLISSLSSQVIQARNRAMALEEGRTMLQASRPILEIQMSLNKAQEALQFHSRPALRYEVRQSLPDLSAHLLGR